MHVAVTGGSGLAGHYVVDDLVEHGYVVTNIDRIKRERSGSVYRRADLEDLGQAYGCLSGVDAVIHLAAIPRPGCETNDVVFRTNVLSTYHVLEASANLGIQRVILASSISVLGFPFFYRPLAPHYVPIDEAHPLGAQDPYALTKVLGEDMAAAFARRTGMVTISLRFAWVHTPETFMQQILPLQDNPAAGASNLWSYIDTRDVAQACRQALETDLIGHEAFFVAAPNTFMKTSTAELLQRFYPNTTYRDSNVDSCRSLLSSAKAAQVLGYQAQYSWEMYSEGVG